MSNIFTILRTADSTVIKITPCSLFFHSIENNKTVGLSVLQNAVYMHFAWASAHNGKWGQLTPLEKMDEKLRSEKMHKIAVFYVYVIF